MANPNSTSKPLQKGKFTNLLAKAFTIALKNIWRNKVISLATIFVIGIILLIFNVILSINLIAENSFKELNSKIDLIVYLKESTEKLELNSILKELEKLPGVSSVTFTSKEMALKKMEENHPELISSFEKYGLRNPLPASISIKSENSLQHQKILASLKNEKYQKYFLSVSAEGQNPENQSIAKVSENLINLSQFTRQLILWLMTTFLIGSILIIYNSIKLAVHGRKKEIEIMKLVGAPYWFIKLPYVLESIFYAIASSFFSFLILFFLLKKLEFNNASVLEFYSNLNFQLILLIEVLLTMVISCLSSLIAIDQEL